MFKKLSTQAGALVAVSVCGCSFVDNHPVTTLHGDGYDVYVRDVKVNTYNGRNYTNAYGTIYLKPTLLSAVRLNLECIQLMFNQEKSNSVSVDSFVDYFSGGYKLKSGETEIDVYWSWVGDLRNDNGNDEIFLLHESGCEISINGRNPN